MFNHHAPIEINSSSISHVDLNPIESTPQAVANGERVLILTPLKDAAPYLSKYFELIAELTYPHHLIDLAFLVGDGSDDTLAVLASELDRIQQRLIRFRSTVRWWWRRTFSLHPGSECRGAPRLCGPRSPSGRPWVGLETIFSRRP